MTAASVTTDKGIGLGALFGVLAVLGAAGMLASTGQVATAWAFALAVTAGVVSVVAVHAFWG